MSSKLTERDKILLKAGGMFTPGTRKYEGGPFGTQLADIRGAEDYVLISVIEPSTGRVILSKELEPINQDGRVIVKPGIDLREMGFASGRFNFRYEFYRRLAGSDDVVLVRSDEGQEGNIYDGPYYINAKNQYLSGGPNMDEDQSFELIPTRLNYEVAEISNARDEIRIRCRNINDQIYKDALHDRMFAFKNVIIDSEYRDRTSTEPVLRFYNPFNPDLSSAANAGFGAGSGGPPVDDDPSSTHIILEDGQGFYFQETMEGGTIKIKDAYIIGEVEQLLVTEANIIANPSGDTIVFGEDINPLKPSGVFDPELHTDAIVVEAWSDGPLTFQSPLDEHYGTAALGYHAKWVKGEGRNGGQCIKFIDQNAIYRNDDIWPENASVHRPLVISTTLPAISNYGVTPGQDLFYMTFYQKSSNLNKGATIRIKYAEGFGAGEPRPTNPPDGYHIPNIDVGDYPDSPPDDILMEPGEPKPAGDLVDGQGTNSLSPNKQWYVSSIQSGMYVWEPNYDRYALTDGSSIKGIRKVGTITQTEGTDGTTRNWIWKGTTWVPEIPPNIVGCMDPSALNFQSYATENDSELCTYQQSILPSTTDFTTAFKCRHKELLPETAFANINADNATFFLKYDDTLRDYHIWATKYGGSENGVKYRFGLSQLFPYVASHGNYQFYGGNAGAYIEGVRVQPEDGDVNSRDPDNPGPMALMTYFGKIVDITEYHRYNKNYHSKAIGLIIFVRLHDFYREYLVEEKGANATDVQGMVIGYTPRNKGLQSKGYGGYSDGRLFKRNSNGTPRALLEASLYSHNCNPQDTEIGDFEDFRQAVFEDKGNEDEPRLWILSSAQGPGRPSRIKAFASLGSAPAGRVIDPFKINEYALPWYDSLNQYDAFWGDDQSGLKIGLIGDQLFARANNMDNDEPLKAGFPKPITDIFPGVGTKDLYVRYGCCNPFARNYGEIVSSDPNVPDELAGTNPVLELTELISNAPLGQQLIISQQGQGTARVTTIAVIVENESEEEVTQLNAGSGTLITMKMTKENLIARLQRPTLLERRTLNIPNIDGGNCDFSVSNDPMRDGTLSPGGFWKWNGPDAVWEYQGESPAALTYKYLDLAGTTDENSFLNRLENGWQQFQTTGTIPADMLINEPMEVVVEGHRVGGTLGDSSQGIVWVDDFDLRFQKPGETTTQKLYADYVGRIVNVEGDDILKLDKSFQEVGEQVGALQIPENTGRTETQRGGYTGDLTRPFNNFDIRYRVNDDEELRTYIEVRGEKYLTTNFKQDLASEVNYPHGLVYKLYNPLDSIVSPFDGVKIVKEMMEPYEDSIDLIDYVPREIQGTVLLSPKLEDSDGPVRARPIPFKKEDDILTANPDIKEKLQDTFLSGSAEDVELNIPFEEGFKEFCHFSSATKRIENFKYKLQLLESYKIESASSAALTQASYGTTKKDVDTWHYRIRNVKSGFTPFEKYMYYQSSSYASSSTGIVYDNAWPKVSGNGSFSSPYVLAHTTSSEATSWYNLQIASSSEYDIRNGNNLINNIPEFLNTSENQAYLDFVKMMGEFFDKIWLYTKQIEFVNDRRDSSTQGLAKQLYYSVAKSLGWGISDGKDLIDLPDYALGQKASGSAFQELQSSEQDISREIWSRIVANMPYFLKNKGTVRALKGLINCYGIPSSILRVREYGGPDTPSAVNFAIDRKFSKALGFLGGQKVDFSWQAASASVAGDKPGFPDTIEWRFRAPFSRNQWLWHKGSTPDMGVVMKDNGRIDNIGSLAFFLSGSNGMLVVSSSEMPIYDNEFYSAMVRRTVHSASIDTNVDYELVVKKYDAGIDRFQYVSSTSMTIDGTAGSVSESYNQAWDTFNTFHIGGNGKLSSGAATQSLALDGNNLNNFSGSMMEFRIWTEVLNTASFDNHANNPKAYDGNTISSSYEALVSRYSFDDDKNLNIDTSIDDVSAKTTETQDATATGFPRNTFEPVVDRTKSQVLNLGPTKITSTKLRIEDNIVRPEFKYVSGSDGFYYELQSEVPIGRGRHDFASNDSNKLGIYFSPSDAINQDIIESLANINFNNYLGDPRDRKEETYRGLERAQDKYWLKYNAPFNFWQYLKLLKTYDQSIFPQLKKLVPARANARMGILVEPNMLERAKENIFGENPTFENNYFEKTIPMSQSRIPSASFEVYGQPYAPSSDTHFDKINEAISYYNNHDPSESVLTLKGEHKYFEGEISQSRLENFEHSILEVQGKPGNYLSASVTFGDSFKDQLPLQPFYSSSRLNPLKGRIRFFYSSNLSASLDMPSSFSYEPAEVNIPADSSTAMRRLFFEGVKNTKLTTFDGTEPVVVTLTSPTRIITKEPGDSKLDIE